MRFLVAVLIASFSLTVSSQRVPSTREVCFTIDDLPWISAVPQNPATVERHTRALLTALETHRIPAIGFVNEGKLRRADAVDPRQVALLQQWLDAGLELGNHTFSHRDLHTTPLDAFLEDVSSGDQVIAQLLAASGRRPRYFRHPMLHTGRSLEVKHGLESYLARRGYRVAPVTIDNYDYVFARAFDRAAEKDRARVLDAYIAYMTAIVAFYEQQSQLIVGREIRQTLLLHANALNAVALPRLARMFEQRGYTFITLDRALEDPAYALEDTYTGPAGITWLHRWALTQGTRGIFAGEPTVPEWIATAGK